ncbi:MAG: M6 family metalloprotease domain-containing protein [Verrucomicrobiota bacterium]
MKTFPPVKLSGSWRRLVPVAACWLAAMLPADAAPYPPEGLSTVWRQPDGRELALKVFGDEFYGRTTTEAGYTVIFDEASQTWFYAEKGPDGVSLVSSGVAADQKVPPGLLPQLSDDPAKIQAKRRAMVEEYAPDRAAKWQTRVRQASPSQSKQEGSVQPADAEIQAAPLVGAQAGLTILVQFPDDPSTPASDAVNFPTSRSKMERWSNETGYTDDGNTGSVKDYYFDQSNGALTLTQVVTAVVTMPRPRSYYNYSDYPTNQTVRPDSGQAGRLLVTDAINKLKGDGFNFSGLSVDSGNRVLATSLLFAGPDSGNWAKGLWPHAWTLSSGINVGTAGAPRYIQRYQITNQANTSPVIGTFIHELGHLLLDYPDLYDTDPSNGDSEGIGQHCLMGSGNFQNGGRTPAPINLYLKGISGWGNITDLTPGSLLDAALPSTGNVGYRIRKPGKAAEYFLFENRGTGDKWTTGALDKGIIAWHVDETVSGNDNQQMTSSSHYEVSLEQADGRFDLEQGINRGDSFDFFDSSNPFLTNDTNPDADWWDGNPSSIRMEVTSAAGATMNVKFGGTAPSVYLGVSPTTANIPAAGGTFSFNVNASGSWSWARSSALVSSEEPRNQTGIQTFTYTIAANPGSLVRQYTITLTSGTLTAVLTIVQAGVLKDDYANNIANATVIAPNGSLAGTINYARDVDYFKVNVTGSGALTMQTTGTTDTYGFLLNSSGQTLTQDDDSGADSNFRISYPVTAGTYYISIQNYVDNLTGAYTLTTNFSSTITLAITPATRAVPGSGGTYDFSINSNSTWSWSSNAAWVTASEQTNQNGPQSFTYNVLPQTAAAPRSAVITLTSGAVTSTHTINQDAAVVDDHGNSLATATLIQPQSTTPGIIEAQGDEDYFRIVVPGSATLSVRTTGNLDTEGFLMDAAGTELANDDDDVDSNFLITWPVTAGTYYVKVRPYVSGDTGAYSVVSALASAPYLTLPATTSPAPAAGATQSIAVSSNAVWSWSISQPWITAPGEAANQSNDQTFEYQVAANPLATARSATITFSSPGLGAAVLTITQSAAGPAISQQPVGVAIQPDGEAVLTVVTAAPSVSYQWYAGVAGNTSLPVPDATGDTLRISPMVTTSYWVRLSNAQGITDSNVAVVTVDTTAAGAVWTLVAPLVNTHLRAVIWAGSQFVAVGDAGVILTSPDGILWEGRTSGTTERLESVAWNGSMLVAVGSGGAILSSPDGVAWTLRPSGFTAFLRHITWNGSAFLAVADGALRSSADGVTWQSFSNNAGGLLTIRWLEGTLCGTGDINLSTSVDAITWTPRLTLVGSGFTDVASNGSQWVVSSSDGKVRRSSNRGLDWSAAQAVTASGLQAVVSDGSGYVVAGAGGTLLTSPDGTVWTARTSGTTQALNALAWNGRMLIAVGDAGAVIRSGGARPAAAAMGYYSWATSFGLSEGATASWADSDGDGLSNAGEFIHGTRPADAAHRAALEPEIFLEQGVPQVRLRYPYNPQADLLTTRLERSSDGQEWTTLTPVATPDGTGYTVRHDWSAPLSTLGEKTFFRFKYLVP